MRPCIKCKENYPEESYEWNRSGLSRKSKCPNCVAEAARIAQAKHRAKLRGPDWQPKIHAQTACSEAGHVCKHCTKVKSCDSYFASNTFKYGHESTCKDCKNQLRRDRIAKEQDEATKANTFRKDKITTLRRRYNITLEQYNYMLAQQNGVCALCEQDETRISGHTGKVMHFAVDHDRRCCSGITSCGKCVRGLLCTDCNTSLGKVECKPRLVEKFNLNQYINNRPLESYDN